MNSNNIFASENLSESARIHLARESSAKAKFVAIERVRYVREKLIACYKDEGVNHQKECKKYVNQYLVLLKDINNNESSR